MKDTGIDYNNWEEIALDRAEWRKTVKQGCRSLHNLRIERAELKQDLRKGKTENLPDISSHWKCETCGRFLLSKAGYINHLKSHQRCPTANLPPQPDSTTCAVCSKVCKSIPGLKRHMVVHKDEVKHPDTINPVRNLSFVCHLCHRPCKSAAGLRSHLRAHGRKAEAIEEQ